jgi:ketosteroid isomerase-like protein
MASDPIKVVLAFVEAINRHDAPALAELMTPEHTFVDSRGTTVSGREAMMVGWSEYFRMFPDFRIQIEITAASGGMVAAFGSTSGTYNGRRGLVPANRIEMPAAWKAVVQGDQIAHWQVYTDWTEGCRIIDEDKRQG